MAGKSGRVGTGVGLLTTLLYAVSPASHGAEPFEAEDGIEVRIDAPTMMAALVQFSQQTGLQLLFPTEGATRMVAPRVQGHLTPRAALARLLQDSGLKFEFVNSRTVSVSLKAGSSSQDHIAVSGSRAGP